MAFFLNKVELTGIIGQTRISEVGERTHLRCSVAVSVAYKDREGCPVVETTWLSCVCWDGCCDKPLESIKKGDYVHITGRLRALRYVDSGGADRVSLEVLAKSLEILPGDKPLEMETL